ncbi:EGF-containing fibulin-like extracellular matrix protein 2 isoform X1 [Patagioenas fasciata]|uniref:EGF-containing fibulin-like extracellular matrix protein 2 isoform X1 n=1 Tax=Patagioenas fasciata TaxID=372321 RepID=UPI003A99166D
MGPWCFLPLPLLLLAAAAPPDLEEPEEYTECSDGYEWDPETEHCKDVDECEAAGPLPACRGRLRCLNHFGGYLCLPRSAALLSPAHSPAPPPAPPTPPLAPPPPPLDTPPAENCPPGYEPAPNGGCQDVDECGGPGPSPCRPSQDCVNTPGGFQCRCPPGYRLRRTECVDEDECRFRWCQHGCANSPGAFSCRCHAGFRLEPDGRSCGDVDECSMGARCSQLCLNTFGSFRCHCRPGFRLRPDGRSCDDVDECSVLSVCRHRCINSPGSFSCTCPPGYGADGPHCRDRDECAEGTHGCSGTQRCLNTYGGHRCEPREPPCPAPYEPHPHRNGTCVCPPGVPGCRPLPRWLLLRSVSVPNVPDVPRGLFQLRHPPGSPPTLRGGPPGAFRLRELSNQSSLLELTRPLPGPLDLVLEMELPGLPNGEAPPTSEATPTEEAPPTGKATPPLALLKLNLYIGEHPF